MSEQRQSRARRPRNCPRCRYEVVGLPYGTPCPECGQSLLVEDVAKFIRIRGPLPRALWWGGLIASGVVWFVLWTNLQWNASKGLEGAFVSMLFATPSALLFLVPLLLGRFLPRSSPMAVSIGVIVGGWLVAFSAVVMLLGMDMRDAMGAVAFITVPLFAVIPAAGLMILGALAGLLIDAIRRGPK